MKRDRVYLDTSVIGGFFDEEFEVATRKLFELFKAGVYIPVISNHTLNELKDAPENVKDLVNELSYEYCENTIEAKELAKKYIEYKVVSEKYRSDAEHIAIATVMRVDLLVSWNFKHIVHYQKIKGFNKVNLFEKYGQIEIRNPKEVIIYED